MRKIVLASFFICLILVFSLYKDKGFDPKNLYTTLSIDPSPPLLDPKIRTILKQKFYFLGQGSQMAAFCSEDGKVVLKIFKGWHVKPKKISRWVSHLFKNKKVLSQLNWQKKFHSSCSRYEMAFKELKGETALLYLHFTKTQFPDLTVSLYDHKKRGFNFDLNTLPFLLQKKATLLPDFFSDLAKHHEHEKIREAIDSLENLFSSRTKKGFTDVRQSLRINYGFVEGRAIQIDVGKIIKDPSLIEHPEEEIERLHDRIHEWIHKYYPQFVNNTAYKK